MSTRRTPAPSPPQSTTWTAAVLLPRQGSRQSPEFWLQMQALLSSSMARAMAAECGLAAQVRQVNTGAHAFVQTSRPNRPGWSPTRHGRAPISRRLRLSWPPSPPNKIPPRLARGEENKCFFLIHLSVWETPESTGKIAAFCTRSDERRSPPGLTGLLNRTHPLVVPSSAPANDC